MLGEAPTQGALNVMPILTRWRPANWLDSTSLATTTGTAIRDYIHVVDVAEAHVVALDHMDDSPGMQIFKVSRYRRRNVRLANAQYIRRCVWPRHSICHPRPAPGDVAGLIADPKKLASEWNWRTGHDLDAMCRHAWRFHCQNPHGYQTAQK